jgi:hypothetical protein
MTVRSTPTRCRCAIRRTMRSSRWACAWAASRWGGSTVSKTGTISGDIADSLDRATVADAPDLALTTLASSAGVLTPGASLSVDVAVTNLGSAWQPDADTEARVRRCWDARDQQVFAAFEWDLGAFAAGAVDQRAVSVQPAALSQARRSAFDTSGRTVVRGFQASGRTALGCRKPAARPSIPQTERCRGAFKPQAERVEGWGTVGAWASMPRMMLGLGRSGARPPMCVHG